MSNILISKDATGFNATFEGDREVFELFGTFTVPTGFTAQANAQHVLKAIREKNPGHRVELTGFARLDELGA